MRQIIPQPDIMTAGQQHVPSAKRPLVPLGPTCASQNASASGVAPTPWQNWPQPEPGSGGHVHPDSSASVSGSGSISGSASGSGAGPSISGEGSSAHSPSTTSSTFWHAASQSLL